MKKNLIALAVAGALCAPLTAFADDSTITLYGKLNLGISDVKAEGATASVAALPNNPDVKSRTRIEDSFSYIGVRGEEPLSGSLKAWFQVESLVKADSAGGNITTGGAASNSWASRNSGVGLRGNFGEILLGRWDTYYADHLPAGDLTFARTAFASTALSILGGQSGLGGINASAQTVGGGAGQAPGMFGGRLNNIVRYSTPNIAGFTGRFTYVTPEGRRNYTDFTGNTADASPDQFGAVLLFQTATWFADLSYLKSNDQPTAAAAPVGVGAVAGNDGEALKAAFGARFGGFQFGVLGERLKREAPALAFAATGINSLAIDRERDAYVLFAAFGQGPWQVGATFGEAKNVKDKLGNCSPDPLNPGSTLCDNTKARYVQVTGVLNFSKRTNIYLTFAKVSNESNANYDFFNEGAVSETTLIGRGSDPTAIVLGINHFF